MKILNLAWALFAVVTLGAGCAGSVSSQSGSNSNWLEICSKDADCTGSLKCWCGTCSSVCTSDSDCGTLASGATCATPETAKAVCGGTATTRACVLACTTPSDCASLGDGATCTDGTCRKASATKPTTDGGSLTCAERETEATTAAAAIVAKADTSCNTDNDCVASSGVRCGNSVCSETPVSKTGAAAIAPTLASLDQRLCTPFTTAGCAAPFANCPAMFPPVCESHVCKPGLPMVYIEGGVPPTDAGNLTCAERTAAIDNVIHADWAKASGPCSVDADCTVAAGATGCDTSCPAPTTKANARALASQLQAVETELCPAFVSAGCKPSGGSGSCRFAPPGTDAGIPFPVKCISGLCQAPP